MKNYKRINNITGWLVFVISSVVYLLTIEPTASFWDCGEFISTSYKLEVGHPPGAPFFMIVGKFFSLFAKDPQHVAKMINSLSAIASGATILFLFWTITHLAKKIVVNSGEEMKRGQIIKIIGSGLVGALAYTFSDTFWFSAVEGEVYALSSLFTAIVFWAILKWENVADEPHANKWLILIAYLMGLSIGVHLLNLLAIPAITLVYYFRKYKVKRNGLIIALGISAIILLSIMYGIIPGIVKVASVFELFFVNTLGLGFNSGILVYALILVSVIIAGIYYSSKAKPYAWVLVTTTLILIGIPFLTGKILWGIVFMGAIIILFYYLKDNKVVLNTILLGATVIVLGYSTFAMIMIRSLADPPMDQNNPETPFGLQYYLNREQYGDRPLFYGQYYSAPINGSIEKKPIYTAIGNKYKKTGYKPEYEYNQNFLTIFPRMYSREARHIKAYEIWGKIKGNKIRARDDNGQLKTIVKPTFGENLRFFFRYQVNFMYLRYFYWNFVGRQNDIQGFGYSEDGYKDVLKGNWLSGIKFIDEARLGPQDNIPATIRNNKARNTYFFLPLLLGLLGAIYQYKKNEKGFWVILTLFFMTGLAIVIYLNQYPYQPRERDYAYAGSFYAFSIWIGIGVMMISDFLRRISTVTIGATLATLVCLVLVPGIMAFENWDDHDRSDRYTARDFAYNYLQSCQKNAVLFTNGDNDTFPLWYIQEVEGVRTDVRVCNLSYLGADWYIEQMQRKAYDSDPLPFTMKKEQYLQGNRDVVYIYDNYKKPIDLRTQGMPFVISDKPETKLRLGSGLYDYFPSKTLFLKVDKEKVMEKGLVNPKFYKYMLDTIQWNLPGRYITKNHLMVLDLLAGNNWERPIYFAITVSSDNYLNLDDYFQIAGLSYKVTPIKKASEDGVVTGIDTDEMFKNMVNKFRWGGVNNIGVYLDENNQRMLMNFRNNFARLAEALYNEGQKEKALKALDKSIEEIPDKSVPYNYVMLPYIDLYYRLGNEEMSNKISDILENSLVHELDYFFRFRGDQARSVSYNIQLNLSVLHRLGQIAVQKGDIENAKRLKGIFDGYRMKLSNIM